MIRTLALALVACGATVSIAHANVEIGGTAGVHVFSSRSELGVADQPDAPSQRNSLLAGFRVGVYFLQVVGIEAELGMIPTVARETLFGVTDLTYRAQLVAQLRARDPEARVLPILFVGAGAFSVIDTKNKNYARDPKHNITADTDAAFYVGAGFKVRAGDHWGLRADARLLAVPSSENTIPADSDDQKVTADFEALISVYADLGEETSVVHESSAPPVDDDPDRDTIHGSLDKCPDDREDPDGFMDDDGCPDPDNDGDGIVDGKDRCPLDAEDLDGVQDSDGCPEHDDDAAGVPHDVQPAIPAASPIVLPPIYDITFHVNSTELEPASIKALDELAGWLRDRPAATQIEIQVHTDDQTIRSKTYANNDELSQARAEALRAYLIAKGLDPNRLSAKGYGSSVPLEDPTGLKGRARTAARAKNRRIELRLH